MPDTTDDRLRCSFCQLAADDVEQLIEGPGSYICSGCVRLCVEILKTPPHGDSAPALPSWRELDDVELLVRLPKVAATAAQVESSLRRWVGEARRRELSWARIGAALDMTRQAAWERFA